MYIHFYHGRKDPNQQLEDWGTDGPTIGPLVNIHQTYSAKITLTEKDKFSNLNSLDLFFFEDCVKVGDHYYGDFEILPKKDAGLIIPVTINGIKYIKDSTS